jgi:hypothetical protein
MLALISPKKAITVSIIAKPSFAPRATETVCEAAQSKGFHGQRKIPALLMIYGNRHDAEGVSNIACDQGC